MAGKSNLDIIIGNPPHRPSKHRRVSKKSILRKRLADLQDEAIATRSKLGDSVSDQGD